MIKPVYPSSTEIMHRSSYPQSTRKKGPSALDGQTGLVPSPRQLPTAFTAAFITFTCCEGGCYYQYAKQQ
jgi:hypothetical protein